MTTNPFGLELWQSKASMSDVEDSRQDNQVREAQQNDIGY